MKSDVVEALVPRYFRKEADRLGLRRSRSRRSPICTSTTANPCASRPASKSCPRSRSRATESCAPKILKSPSPMRKWRSRSTACASSTPHSPRSKAGRWPMETTPRFHSMAQPKQKKTDSKPVHMDEVLVEIGGKNTMPEFTENLRGANRRRRTQHSKWSIPKTAHDQRLAGKTFTYTVKVQAIKQKTLPELNDEFAKELGEFTSLDEVRQRIRESMEAERKHDRRARSQRQTGGGTGQAQRIRSAGGAGGPADRCPPGTRPARPGGAGHEEPKTSRRWICPACARDSATRRCRK